MGMRRYALVAMGGLVSTVLIGQARLAAAPASTTPPLPAATYKTVSQYVMIPMSDGVRLGATITFPSFDGKSPAPGQFPVVFSMTPYGRDGLCGCPSQTEYPSRGIISSVVDVRGTGGSGGNLDGNYFSPREQRDGYELVEWLGTRSWSTGRVGMIGGSYLAITQYMTAEQQPPHLVAIAPDVGLSDVYRDAFTYDGVPDFFFDSQYIAVQGAPGAASGDIGVGGASGSGTDTNPSHETQGVLNTTSAKLSQAKSRPPALDYLERPNDDQWYHDRSPFYRVGSIQVPVLIVDGWRDGAFVRGDLEMYEALASRPSVETRIDVSACTHKGCGAPFDPTHSANGTDDITAVEFDFMSHYLLGTTEHPGPPVSFDLQPAGPYLGATQWPPLGTTFTRFYLHPGATTGEPLTGALASGTLSTAVPGASGAGRYVTDPLAGWSMAFDSYGTIAASPFVPTDQRAEAEQGLTWRTAPSASPMRIVGPIQLHLAASSTGADTDWVARLSDVAPNGSETVVTEGALRASHRALDAQRSTTGSPYHVDSSPQPLVAGTVYQFDVAIIATAYELPAGHSLQLRLTTDDMPTRLPASIRFDATDPARSQVVPLPPATNTVLENASEPSWLLIPLAAG
jgi:uncharacterized protein